jgi:predicted O-methyltransferase YrrM
MVKVTRQFPVVRLHNLRMEESEVPNFQLIEPLLTIPTHMTFEERLKLFEVGMTLLPQPFVACEVGSYVGASTGFLAAAASLRDGHLHAVDTWMNDAMPHEASRDTWQEFLDNTARFHRWITPHRGQSHEVKHEVPSPLDFLFIDGDHSHEGVLADLKSFEPKLKPGGILAMHDFDYDTVRSALGEYLGERRLKDLGCTHSLQLLIPL